MGELWLCREKKAEVPFYLISERMNIYTLEELCYYLYHNIYFLKDSFASQELCLWIGQELAMPRLAALLMEGIGIAARGKASGLRKNVLWFAFMILRESGCYTTQELEELQQICLEMGNKSEFECGKIRADRLLANKRYVSSIREYYKLLKRVNNIADAGKTYMEEPEGSYPILIGNIWHNMAVAHTRLFLFAEAAEYFQIAYEHNKQQESYEAYLAALEFQKGNSSEAAGLPECTGGKDDSQIQGYLKQLKEEYKKKVMEHGIF